MKIKSYILSFLLAGVSCFNLSARYFNNGGVARDKSVIFKKPNSRDEVMCSSYNGATEAVIQAVANGNWNQASTWQGGQIPTANDDVKIPAGRIVTLSGNCNAKTIEVSGILNASNQAIALETENIVIIGPSGKLEIGTETQPYSASGKCLITLKGTVANKATESHKAIIVRDGGKLELHGKERKSWTNLISTANAGSKQIVLKEAVDWEIGDIIALTSTDLANASTKSWENVDQVEIEGISADKKTIALKTPLAFKHVGGSKTYTRATDGKTWTVNIQGEVGLLSHYIKIQGKMDGSNQTDGFGGHIMMMKGSTAHVEHVELFKMGQRGILGRYPFHWHLCEDQAKTNYFKNSSVHRSFNRAVTIHGTDYVTVDGIYAYDHIGHGLFLEDGGERYNNIKNNVVFVTRRPIKGQELTPSDNEENAPQNRTPSSYWITNANNYFENNVAAGTEGTGFWIVQPDGKPLFSSGQIPYFQGVNPVKEPLGRFNGFVAHTCMNGWDIFDRLEPNHSINKNHGWIVTTNQNIDNGLFYGNETALYCGLSVDADPTKIFFRNCIFSDNETITMLAGDLNLENCLFNADSDLGVFDGVREFFRFYDGPGRHISCHFEGWDRKNAQIIKQITGGGATENFNPTFRGTTKGFSTPFHFEFIPLPNNNNTRAKTVGQFFKDYDGGLTGKAHTTIVRDIPFLLDGHEYRHPSWRYAARSDYYFASLWLTNFQDDTKISVTRSKSGTNNVCFYEPGGDGGTFKFPMIVNQGFLYTYTFDKIPTAKSFSVLWSRGDNGDLGYACFKGLGKLGNLTVSGTRVNTKAEIDSQTNTSYFIAANGDVFVKLKCINPLQRTVVRFDWDNMGSYSSTPLECTTNDLTGKSDSDTDGDGKKDFEEDDICGLSKNAADLNFEFNQTNEDFKRVNLDVSNTTSDVYWLLRADKSSNSYIERNGLKFKGSEVPQLKIRIRSEAAGSFKLSWTTINDPDYSANKSVTVNPRNTNVFEELEFDMKLMNSWMGQTITKLKLDFPSNSSADIRTLVDYIHGPKASNDGCLVTSNKGNEVELEQFLVFPNPSDNGIFKLMEFQEFSVLDVQGRLISKGKGYVIDLSSNSKGVYILHIGEKQIRIVK